MAQKYLVQFGRFRGLVGEKVSSYQEDKFTKYVLKIEEEVEDHVGSLIHVPKEYCVKPPKEKKENDDE